jgi:hypothetical protein
MAGIGMYLYQMAQGSSTTYPAGQRVIINSVDEEHAAAQHIVITSDGDGEYYVNGDYWAMDETGSVDVPDMRSLVIQGNTPNPFNPATNIHFELSDDSPVILAIYDLTGRLQRSTNINALAGVNSWRWDGRGNNGRDLSSGVYIYRISTSDQSGSGRMTLAR